MSSQQSEFADFFQASWDPCLRAVVAVVGSPQLAEDQLAEAFAKAWAVWPRVRRHPAARAWVVRTALNTGASWWRRRQRELPLADHDLTAPGDPSGGLDATLLTAIWRLPARQREVIALRIFLDLDTATIATQLGSRRERSGCTCPAASRRCATNSPQPRPWRPANERPR